MSQTLSSKADPITTEIIRNAFLSLAQDMNASLIRSAYTPIIYEGKDCSVALLDERGEVLGQSLGVPPVSRQPGSVCPADERDVRLGSVPPR